MYNPLSMKDTSQYDYPAASPDTRDRYVDPKYTKSIHFVHNFPQTQLTGRIDQSDPKYQTAPFTDNPTYPHRHSQAAHRGFSTAESLESKPGNFDQTNPVFTDYRKLPYELESVQERSIEQSERTHKGSTARLREEKPKQRTDIYADRDVNTVLDFSSESSYARTRPRQHAFPSEGGAGKLDETVRDDDFVNIRSPQDRRLQQERSRELSKSVGKAEFLKSPEESRRNLDRNRSSGLLVEEAEETTKPYPRELNKTMGSLGNYKYTEEPESDAKAKESRVPSVHAADKPSVQRPGDLDEAWQQIERLESKLRAKDKLIEVMKGRHEEIWQKFQNSQQELFKIKSEQEYTQHQYQMDKLQQKISRLETAEAALSRENEELIKAEKEAMRKIHDLDAEIQHLQSENMAITKRYQSKIETLVDKIKEIEYSTQTLRDPTGEISMLKKIIEENSLHTRSLENQIEELQRKNEVLSRIIRDQDRKIQKAEQIEEDFRSIVDDRVNQTLHETSRNYSHKLKKYKHIIQQLEAENSNLKLELKARPTLRQQRETEGRSRNVELGVSDDKSLPRGTMRSPEAAGPYQKLVAELKNELGVESSAELIPKVRDLLASQKTSAKFNAAVTDMVVKCAPPSYFSGKPSLKESWKFIKTIMEEYISLKKQKSGENQEKERELMQIIENVAAYLGAQSKEEIPNKVKEMVADYNLMDMIILKFKTLMHVENMPSLKELDRALSQLLQKKNEPSNAEKPE